MEKLDNASLLFYLSGADYKAEKAAGQAEPTFCTAVELIDEGVKGKAIACHTRQQLAWKAPHNIYAERGTISFWWRSRYSVGPTAFPIFRVGYADHSSWDQCFLRVDYNGEGLEAFITDINLSKARIHCRLERFPEPDEWMQIALSWDELWGLKLYVNGQLMASEERPAVYFAGLDQFGPHSRIIGPWHVQSDYNFIRGGDFCELSIWDHMLSDEDMKVLAKAELPDPEPFVLDMSDRCVKEGWMQRAGFVQKAPRIPALAAARKVEIHDAYDLKRWWYKGMDGIRETTWPGVYNRSRLKGRNDYFQFPDWDCYSLSGKAITFHMPYEPYNHIEISGSAYGKLEVVDEDGSVKEELFERPQGLERTADRIEGHIGGRIRFTNVEKEEPIGDFSVYNVYEGAAPKGMYSYTYRLRSGACSTDAAQAGLLDFIEGRYTSYERSVYTAVPEGSEAVLSETAQGGYPFYNIIIPYEADANAGLDGVELTFLTGEDGEATYAVQVKDPLWYYRNLAHFTFRCEKSTQQKLWLDTRDRVLPEGRCLYLTVAVSDAEAAKRMMETLQIRTVFKSAKKAKEEHCADRFVQVKDIVGHLTEETPLLKEYATYNRFKADVLDLLKVDPEHKLGKQYLYMLATRSSRMSKERRGEGLPIPELEDMTAPLPEGIPAWAFRQIEYLQHYKKIINWYIDRRQIANGELGGGLSDDGDFVATWGQLALMDSDGEKVRKAIEANEQAFFDQGMFTNGLCSIQADELHSSEEGIVSLAACLNVSPGSPHWLEEAMATARSLDWITGVNAAGHRHVKSSFYSGSVMATEEPWGGQQSCSYIALAVAWQIAQFNGNPYILKILEELADGAVAHYKPEEKCIHTYVRFEDDQENYAGNGRNSGERTMLMPAWKLIGKPEYWSCQRESDRGGTTEKETGIPLYPFKPGTEIMDKELVAQRYQRMTQEAASKEYYNTYGHPWIDRVYTSPCALYCDRLGDTADVLVRCSYPTNRIAWKFTNWGDDERVAILTPVAEKDHIRIIACNISDRDVLADIIGADILPGRWSVSYGVDTDDDDQADEDVITSMQNFERTEKVRVVLASGVTTVIELRLVEEGVPYWSRPDLGVSEDDIRIYDHGINVRIHSLGAVDSPEVYVVLKDADGNVLKKAVLPSLPAPTDLWPKYRDVIFYLHHVESLKGCYVEIDPEHKIQEITRANNIVKLDKAVQKRPPVLSSGKER